MRTQAPNLGYSVWNLHKIRESGRGVNEVGTISHYGNLLLMQFWAHFWNFNSNIMN